MLRKAAFSPLELDHGSERVFHRQTRMFGVNLTIPPSGRPFASNARNALLSVSFSELIIPNLYNHLCIEEKELGLTQILEGHHKR